jgi:hypothetical protein
LTPPNEQITAKGARNCEIALAEVQPVLKMASSSNSGFS